MPLVRSGGKPPHPPERTLGSGQTRRGGVTATTAGHDTDLASDLMSGGGMTAEDVRSMTFEMPPRGRPGHDEKSIDDFLVLALLDKIAAAMAKTR